jgi:ribonuclease BN (tRNA processing enzyme)
MELVVLGCCAGMPGGGQTSSGYLVATSRCRILLDCGPGVAVAVSAHGGAGSLDAIVVTHLHPDHCYDLLPIGTTLRREPRPAPLPLYVPRGGRMLLHNLGGLFPLGEDPSQDIPFHHGFTIHWGHLCATDAARVAADAGVGQLVLTHLGSADPQWAQARRIEATRVFTGPVHLALPGARYLIRRPLS